MLIPDSINPDNRTRADAPRGYCNGFIDSRPNFHVATGQLVTHLRLDTSANVKARDYPAGLWVNRVEVSNTLCS
jgi:hypothetical protein